MKGEGNLSIGGFVYRQDRRINFSMSDGYMYSSSVYGNLCKTKDILTSPFSRSLWLTIVCISVLSMLIILWTKVLSRKWRHFYIGGRMNRTAIFNAYAVVLGHFIANPRMNGRSFGNFSRTLTIFWMFLWFFIRNHYEGALYVFLQGRTKSPYDTIEKVLESDCKVLFTASVYPYYAPFLGKNR